MKIASEKTGKATFFRLLKEVAVPAFSLNPPALSNEMPYERLSKLLPKKESINTGDLIQNDIKRLCRKKRVRTARTRKRSDWRLLI